jgi:hypothetical protein
LSGSPLGHFSRLGLRLGLAHLHYSVFESVALCADLKKSWPGGDRDEEERGEEGGMDTLLAMTMGTTTSSRSERSYRSRSQRDRFRICVEKISAEFVFDTLAMSFSSSSTLALEAALSSLIANRQQKDKARAVAKPQA